jgi:hypothetical protein
MFLNWVPEAYQLPLFPASPVLLSKGMHLHPPIIRTPPPPLDPEQDPSTRTW